MQIIFYRWKCAFLLIFILSILFPVVANAQNTKVSELEKKLAQASSDTARLSVLQELSIAYTSIDPKQKFRYAKQYKNLAEKLEIDSVVINGYIDMGISYGIQSRTDSALYFFSKSYEKSVKIGFEKGKGRSLVSIGFTYARLDDKQRAVKKYSEALEIFKRIRSTRGINQCYINIGSIYFDMAEYELAQKYFYASYKTYREENDEFGMAGSMFSLGNTQRLLGNLKKAKEYYSKSLAIREKRGEPNGIALANWGLGIIENIEGKPDKALEYFEIALKHDRKLSDDYHASAVLISMAESYMAKKDFKKAESLALEALQNGMRIHSLVIKTQAYDRLAEIAEKANQIRKAYDYQSNYLVMLDSINKEKAMNDIKLIEFDRVQSENEGLIKDNDLITEKSSNYLRTIFIVSVLLVMVIFLSVLLYRRFLEKKSTNLQLEKQKEEIAVINKELASLNEELTTQMHITAAQNDELEQLNIVKNKFFSIVSHDLRSPLATLQMLFRLYRRGQLSEAEMNEMLNALEETIYMTTVFLDNLLNWSKSQLEGMTIKPSVFDVGDLITENIRLIETQIQMKQLSVENTTEEYVNAYADLNMMNVVIRNLLSNSVKFCKEGDRIILDAKTVNDKMVFTIKDNGPGISQNDIDHLFELEHTVSLGTSGEAGHHIGLILCRDLILQNNGKIWVESEFEKGTTFWVELPNKKNS